MQWNQQQLNYNNNHQYQQQVVQSQPQIGMQPPQQSSAVSSQFGLSGAATSQHHMSQHNPPHMQSMNNFNYNQMNPPMPQPVVVKQEYPQGQSMFGGSGGGQEPLMGSTTQACGPDQSAIFQDSQQTTFIDQAAQLQQPHFQANSNATQAHDQSFPKANAFQLAPQFNAVSQTQTQAQQLSQSFPNTNSQFDNLFNHSSSTQANQNRFPLSGNL